MRNRFFILISLVIAACSHNPVQAPLDELTLALPENLKLYQKIHYQKDKKNLSINAVIQQQQQSTLILLLSQTGRRLGQVQIAHNNTLNFDNLQSPINEELAQKIAEAFILSAAQAIKNSAQWSFKDQPLQRKIAFQQQDYAEIMYTSRPLWIAKTTATFFKTNTVITTDSTRIND